MALGSGGGSAPGRHGGAGVRQSEGLRGLPSGHCQDLPHQNGMGRSFSAPKPEILVEDFTKNNTFYHAASDTHYKMLRRGDRIFQRRYQLGFDGKETNADEKEVDYIVGSGNHMLTYAHRNPDGTPSQLPLAWYAEKGGYWAINPGCWRSGPNITKPPPPPIMARWFLSIPRRSKTLRRTPCISRWRKCAKEPTYKKGSHS
jgi:hypothetical protein